MALGESMLWSLLPILSLLLLRGQGCPTACRCYSMTVECGSLSLQSIPPGIPPITQTVFLQDNSITQIHQADLASLSGLQYLYMQNNSLWALEPGAFVSQQQLVELALNRNRIHLLNSSIFKGLDHLRVLYLAGNQITRLLDFTFCYLPRLQELHLQENSIELLEDQALAGLSSLALLDLSKNQLSTISRDTLVPLASLQVLRLTENPWRCDCALHWLGAWIKQGGQRLLGPLDKKIACAEPPRLAHQGLLEVPANSLICIPPAVRVEPAEATASLGDDLRVSCRASGYPQPLVTWRKVAPGAGPARPGGPGGGAAAPEAGAGAGAGTGAGTGSGMLALGNITPAHAGRYECEARNPGGSARAPFVLLVSLPRPPPPPPEAGPAAGRRPPPPEAGSLDFGALGAAPQAAVAAAIALLALTALLLAAMICRKHRRKQAKPEESVLYVNDYSDGPTTFAQLEEYRDERGHEMFVIDRNKPLFPAYEEPGPAPGPEPPPDPGALFQPQIAYEIHC
ncbi:leucine-rich repeat-containing protein 24 [Macrotis lagotis]|uniref:leucine-rich repeat-containing protein 24 n=1 Tax=Macrotis lagotis TaxID=92651 RepID=UPI003D695F3A